MKKLHLDLDSLRVESFGTGSGSAGGTVNGHSFEIAPDADRSRIESCFDMTCYDTCDWTQ